MQIDRRGISAETETPPCVGDEQGSEDFRGTVAGQQVAPEKLERSRQLRSQMTRAERILWQQLRAHHMSGVHFRRQQVLDGFIVDFYCHAAKLVVEVDGDVHVQQQSYDQARDEVLAARGLRILRVRNEDVYLRLPDVLQVIKTLLSATPSRYDGGIGGSDAGEQ